MRRASLGLLMAFALAALAAPPARGQSADRPTPVVGGGTFNTAPRVAPGTYRDTILPNENLFYAIDVRSGQTLSATLELDGVDERTYDLSTVSTVRVQLHGPLRDADPNFTGFATTLRMFPIEAVSEPAQTLAGSVGAGRYTGPGRWYVSVSAGADEDARIELPFALRLTVAGDPVEEPRTATTQTAPPPARTEAGDGASGDDDSSDGGARTGAVAGIGAGGLVAGAAAGLLLARRRRRGPGAH